MVSNCRRIAVFAFADVLDMVYFWPEKYWLFRQTYCVLASIAHAVY